MRTLLFKMVISIFKTKNLNFYTSNNFLHSNALGDAIQAIQNVEILLT